LGDLDWGRILRLGIPALIGVAALWGVSAWLGSQMESKGSGAAAAPATTADAGGPLASGRLAGVAVRFRWIPPGPEGEGAWILEDEVANDLWAAVLGGSAEDPRAPVAGVSYAEAQAFCDALASKHPGLRPRLPTLAEWERAGRGVREAESPVAPAPEILAWWAGRDGGDVPLPELRLALDRAGVALAPAPTGPGAGLRHLGGNLQEWVESPGDGGVIPVLCGGSAAHPPAMQAPTTLHQVVDAGGEPWTGMRFVLPGGAQPAWPAGLAAP
ncbi:MAG: hypothetical protein RLZZ127_2470, partial [Planctomycetota bacterium]